MIGIRATEKARMPILLLMESMFFRKFITIFAKSTRKTSINQ